MGCAPHGFKCSRFGCNRWAKPEYGGECETCYAGEHCRAPNCRRPCVSKGFCPAHRHRLRKGMDLSKPLKAHGEREGTLSAADPQGYLRIKIGGEWLSHHRYVMSQKLGRELLPSETVHHRNGNRHDNRIENLELRRGNHGPGQTVNDLVEYLVEFHRPLVYLELTRRGA